MALEQDFLVNTREVPNREAMGEQRKAESGARDPARRRPT